MGYAPGLAFLGTVKLRVLWGLAQVLVHISTVKINVVRIDGPRGGVNWAFVKFLEQIKATLTYAMLVRLNSPTG